MLYGDYGFREAALGKCPNEIKRELEERARRSIGRSMEAGVAMFKPNWPWLRGLEPDKARH
jgi:hypothetical protein